MTIVSIIIATYNNPRALKISLESLFSQTRLPDEVVIADDGSTRETAELVRAMGDASPFPIIHAWQEDKGFRVAAARNNGIERSSGEYLIFLDGDCYTNPNFIADHLAVAKPHQFVAGTRVNIQQTRQDYIFSTGDSRITFWSRGTSKKFHAIRLPFFRYLSRPTKYFATANCAIWRTAIEQVNGFNEEFEGHGGEDIELAVRLCNAGNRGIKMRHGGVAYHLAHAQAVRGDISRITAILRDSMESKRTRCQFGLTHHRNAA